jgi:transcriptional regulator with XRE-family HTH domain
MVTADLIREARLRGGLTQMELAERIRRPQSTVARWERGVRIPSLETTREVVRACGLDLGFALARYDDSYDTLVDTQLMRAPASRIPDEARETLAAGVAELGDLDYVMVGPIAEVLRGSPLGLPSPAHARVVVADAAAVRATHVEATDTVAGAAGIADLRRDADRIELAPGVAPLVASLRDLVRIAEASPDSRSRVPALRVTLERTPST